MNAKDPYRALDGVEPADRWDDIVERAERPAMEAPVPLADRRPLHQRPLLVAAAVLAVLAVAGVAVAATRGGNDQQEVTASEPDADPPTALWGRSWDLVSITDGGEDRPVVPAMDGEPVRLDATVEGRVSARGCNQLGAEVQLEGDRLEAVDGAFMTAAGCIGGDGEALMAQDDLLQGLFAGGSVVTVRGDDLTLTKGDLVTRWVAVGSDRDGAVPFWGQRWEVVELVHDGAPVELLPSVDGGIDDAPTAQVLDTTAGTGDGPGLIRVTGGCAARQGLAELGSDGVLVLDGPSWRPNGPMCTAGDMAAAQIEAIVAVLVDLPTVTIDGNVLTIASADGENLLVAEADEMEGAPIADDLADLWGVKWKVERLVDDGVERPLVQPPGSTPITLIGNTSGFPQRTSSGQLVDSEATGAISVATGCNGAGGPAHLEGNVLVADPGGFDDATGETYPGWVSTRKGCAADAETQDRFLMELLQSGPTVTIEGDRLTIAKGDDRLEAVRVATEETGNEGEAPGTSVPAGPTTTVPNGPGTTVAPTIPLPPPSSSVPVAGADAFFDRRWTVTSVSGAGSSEAFEGASVDTRGGRVVVAGCNGAGGPMRLEGNRLVPNGDWSSTAKGCTPTDGKDLMAQDVWFGAFLRAGPSLEVRGTLATLATADDVVELSMS